MSDDTSRLADLTAVIVTSYASANTVSVADLPGLIKMVHEALRDAGTAPVVEAVEEAVRLSPAQIRKSITPDALISFVDGKPYKTLKRHLARHGLTLAAYKARFGLPADYPTTAPSYSERRSQMAKAAGLGQGGRKPSAPVKAKAGAKRAAKAAVAPRGS